MSTDWYLMNCDHDSVSGFESEDHALFATDAFGESLNSSLGVDVEICNYDLSVRTPLRVIIEGNLQDTRLNALNRKMLSPIGSCKAGQYVYYKNRYWLIEGLVDDNGIYEKSVLKICNYKIAWLNGRGEAVERWACVQSASQYNNGETNAKYFYIRSDQTIIALPGDDESLLIPHGKRFVVDLRTRIYEKGFDPSITKDTSKPLVTYNATRMDTVLFDYQDSGHTQFLASQDEQHDDDGYYVIDGKGYWLCEDPSKFQAEKSEDSTLTSCRIVCEEPVIYIGLEPSIFYAEIQDQNGNDITGSITPTWVIECDFEDLLKVEYINNAVIISADNKKILNKTLNLSFTADGYTSDVVTVKIKQFI